MRDFPPLLNDYFNALSLLGRYDDLDYRAEPNPPLTSEDAAWAEEMLKAKGLR